MNWDVDFSVSFRHRIRFTTDLAGDDFSVLIDLLTQQQSSQPPKVLLIIDDGLQANSSVHQLVQRLEHRSNVDLVSGGVPPNCHSDRSAKVDPPEYFFPGGEACKNSTGSFDRILALIDRNQLDRQSYIVVLGGGALLDCVGLAAATAHRGVRLIRIPTTTLAQADSGVGVKNAVNFFGKKNWLGTFAVPWAVINDAAMLKTLSDRDFFSGFSEAFKVALLKSKPDFEFLCDQVSKIRKRDSEVTLQAIQRSCRLHLEHITQGGDPFETREARPLDFGHWAAHKLESLTDHHLRHGEAVAVGVLLDCTYSHLVLGLGAPIVRRVTECFQQLGLPVWLDVLRGSSIFNGLEEFRQHLGGRLTVTMLSDVAAPVDVHSIDQDQMRAAIDQLADWAGQQADKKLPRV